MFEGDPKKAVYWYEQAAEQGDVDELGYAKKINNLGEVYWSGKNVEDLISMRASDVNKV